MVYRKMLLLNTNLTIGHWLLGLLFVVLALACVYKHVAMLKLSIQLSEHERRKRALVAGLYFYGFFIFMLMDILAGSNSQTGALLITIIIM